MKVDSKEIQDEHFMSSSEDQQQFIVFPESKGEMDNSRDEIKYASGI